MTSTISGARLINLDIVRDNGQSGLKRDGAAASTEHNDICARVIIGVHDGLPHRPRAAVVQVGNRIGICVRSLPHPLTSKPASKETARSAPGHSVNAPDKNEITMVFPSAVTDLCEYCSVCTAFRQAIDSSQAYFPFQISLLSCYQKGVAPELMPVPVRCGNLPDGSGRFRKLRSEDDRFFQSGTFLRQPACHGFYFARRCRCSAASESWGLVAVRRSRCQPEVMTASEVCFFVRREDETGSHDWRPPFAVTV